MGSWFLIALFRNNRLAVMKRVGWGRHGASLTTTGGCGMHAAQPSTGGAMDDIREHRFFDPTELAVLLDPGRWSLSAAALPTSARSTDSDRSRRWREHSTHAHPHRELLVAIAGDRLYGHVDRLVRCRPGTVVYFDRMEPHDNGYPPGAAGFTHLWCSLTATGVRVRRWQALANGVVTTRPLPVPDDDELGVHLWSLLERSGGRPGLLRLALQSVVTALAARLVEAGWLPAVAEDASRAARAVDLACRHIAETCGAGISLDGLAQLTGYSRFHFLRLFRVQSGCSLRQFIDRVRRDEVRRLQADGCSARMAAVRLGVASASAFSRWCRRNQVVWLHRPRQASSRRDPPTGRVSASERNNGQ